ARNRGARLARGRMLFFSDEDHVVPLDVIACHELAHRELGRLGVVIGNVFGRRAAHSIAPTDRPEHKKRLLEGLVMKPAFAQIAARVATTAPVTLCECDGMPTWNRVGATSFTEWWMRGWAEILLKFGECIDQYQHRWTRVTAGNLSVPASFFWDVGGFRQDLEALEDWEFGARVQRAGGSIACAPSAEPYHLVHPVFEDRRARDLRSYSIVREVHADFVTDLLNDKMESANPAKGTLKRFEEAVCAGELNSNVVESRNSILMPLACSLTFDDGPHPTGTIGTLDVLRRHQVCATFFCLGQPATKYPDIVRSIVQDGHAVGIHGWTHTNLDHMTSKELRADIERTLTVLETLTGDTIRFIRPPYGRATAALLEVSKELGLQVVG